MGKRLGPSGWEALCPECGQLLEGLENPVCPGCGRTFDPEDDATYALRERRYPMYPAVLSGLFVFGGLLLGCLLWGVAEVTGRLGVGQNVSKIASKMAALSFFLVPFSCVPGVVLAHVAFPRYERRGQVVAAVLVITTWGFGYLFLLLGWPALLCWLCYKIGTRW